MALDSKLILDRCPHCNVDKPSFDRMGDVKSFSNFNRNISFRYAVYGCKNCANAVLVQSDTNDYVLEIFPKPRNVHDSLPDRAKEYLKQANDSLSAPAGAVILAASSVDAMLKDKGYSEGTLYERINKAFDEHLITEGMKLWAHEVRLDANVQRHSDKNTPLPTVDDAKRVIEFATSLGEFLFVLPSKVTRGIEKAKETKEKE